MSTEDKTFIDIAKDKLLAVIQPQILQLANIYLVQLVNTGDRVKDGCLIVVLNAIIALALSSLYFVFSYVGYFFRKKRSTQLDVVEIMKKFKIDEIDKYNHTYSLNSHQMSLYRLIQYAIDEKILDEFYSKKMIKYDFRIFHTINHETSRINFNEIEKISTDLLDESHKNIIFPVYRYNDEKTMKEKYVFCYEEKLVSESFSALKDFIHIFANYICNTYYKKNNNDDEPREFYELQIVDNEIRTKKKGDILRDCTFDNIHFEQKQIMMEWINKFKDNKMYPKGLSLSNKLGILLYGPPGTGKTGCISALANYLNRDVMMINSLNLCDSSKDNLYDFVRSNRKEFIYVFDEFDYLLAEKNVKTNTQISEYKEMLLYADSDERKKIMEELKKNSKNNFGPVDQAYLLKLLDGIGENDGRIIIATTNYPEKINQLFLRPGRFDVKLELGYCTYEMFVSICLVKFEEIGNEKWRERIHSIILKNITPLVLINIIVVKSTIEELLDELESY